MTYLGTRVDILRIQWLYCKFSICVPACIPRFIILYRWKTKMYLFKKDFAYFIGILFSIVGTSHPVYVFYSVKFQYLFAALIFLIVPIRFNYLSLRPCLQVEVVKNELSGPRSYLVLPVPRHTHTQLNSHCSLVACQPDVIWIIDVVWSDKSIWLIKPTMRPPSTFLWDLYVEPP